MKLWLICIQELTTEVYQHHFGATLKRITKVALNAIKADEGTIPSYVGSIAYVRAQVLGGIIDKGVFQRTESRSFGELTEASELLRNTADASEDVEEARRERSISRLLKETAVDQLRDQTGCRTNVAKYEAGLWVIIRDLTSPLGRAMNTKLGLISEDGVIDGRVAVKVDGFRALALLRPDNLYIHPLFEVTVSLVSCLEETDQWEYVRPLKAVYWEKKIVPQEAKACK